MSPQNKLAYQPLEANYAESTIEMFTHAFCDSEPMTHYVDMQYEEFAPFARHCVFKAVKDGLSSIVVENNKVIACCLVEDILEPPVFPPLTPKFDPIFNLLENLTTTYFTEHTFQKNQVAHLAITAVHNHHRGRGLSSIVNLGAADVARAKNFLFMTSDLTNHLNEEGLIKYIDNSKKLIKRIRYSEFIFNGNRPFEHLDGSGNSWIWALQNNLDVP